MTETGTSSANERGIGYWMERVVAERDKASKNFDAEAVHDLRVALRRCRSMAEGFQAVDGDPCWKKMRKAGKILFSALGDLRDTQVLLEWVEQLKGKCPPAAERLRAHCQQREAELKSAATEVLAEFDTHRWLQWGRTLEARVQRLDGRKEVFEVLALERYQEARVLQSKALRNRNKAALHELRIGVKKFRYLVENFLPRQHQQWGKDLKFVQDVLGEVHDLDVLWDTTRQSHACASREELQQWHAALGHERTQRVQAYRQKMVGRSSLWSVWRGGLPAGEALQQAVLSRFAAWTESLDPRPADTSTVTQFSLQLYDALSAFGFLPTRDAAAVPPRDLLFVGAAAHEVGRSNGARNHHKRSRRMLQKLEGSPRLVRKRFALGGIGGAVPPGRIAGNAEELRRPAVWRTPLGGLSGGHPAPG